MERVTDKPVEAVSAPSGEDYVEFTMPRLGDSSKPVLIGVNGEFITVRPGSTVHIKRKFVEAWEHSREQEEAAWQARERAQAASRRALADL